MKDLSGFSLLKETLDQNGENKIKRRKSDRSRSRLTFPIRPTASATPCRSPNIPDCKIDIQIINGQKPRLNARASLIPL